MSLFQTSAWQIAWWAGWSNTPGAKLVRQGGKGRSGTYVHSYRYALPVIKTRCLQYVGTSYRKFSAPRTEYNTLGHPNHLPDVLAELEKFKWTEAVFSDLRSASEELQVMQRWAREHGWLLRTIRQDVAYGIVTTGAFKDYLDSLGRNTRLKLFNRRKMFESLGDVAEENFWPHRAGEFFELLNGFHEVRWGSPCFSDRSVAFHLDFLNRTADDGIQPRLMVLHKDQRPVSVLYNALFGRCVYNIQAGFDENFHRKIALGSLHLGYSIESAFKDPSVDYFDLLAGEGKNTNYKAHLATDREPLTTFMIVRSPIFRLLYRAKDFFLEFKAVRGPSDER